MKQLLAILLCICIFVPEAARIIAGSFCAYTVMDEDANPVCACQFNNVPADMQQTSMPDRHKEIMQQTEWHYLATVSYEYNFSRVDYLSSKYEHLNMLYAFACINSIFHPPCFS